MADKTPSTPMQLIDDNGKLNRAGLNSLVAPEMDGEASYTVVSILGPQSSGKSTLLNQLYGTNFRVMNAAMGRGQTTRGAMLAKTEEIVIMDVEGSDSGERGGHQSFERKLAAFSFVISRIVLVNMSNNDVGRRVAGCIELLEAAFQFMACSLGHHKVTMIIVVRDKALETPYHKIQEQVYDSIKKIWENAWKSDHLQCKGFEECCDVKVVVMPNYRHQKDEFCKEVSELKKQIEEILSDRRTRKYFAREFAREVVEQWNIISRSKELDVPTYKECLAYKQCVESAKECTFMFQKELKSIEKTLESQPIENFSLQVEKKIQCSLDRYDEHTTDFGKSMTCKIRSELHHELLKHSERAFRMSLVQLHPQIIRSFNVLLKENFKSIGGNSSAKEIIEDCVTRSIHVYHQQCKEMMVENAAWDITVHDQFLVRELRRNGKIIHDSLVKEKTAAVVGKTVIAVAAAGVAGAGAGAAVAGVAAATATATAAASATAASATAIGGGVAVLGGVFPVIAKTGTSVVRDIKFLNKTGNYDPDKL